jgi:hypothetical protein
MSSAGHERLSRALHLSVKIVDNDYRARGAEDRARRDREELSELESQYNMPTKTFVVAFRNGRLHESPDFRRWAHLSAVWDLFERRTVRV